MNVPPGWKKRRLGDVLTLINGRAYKKEELLDQGTPVLRIQNLNGGDRWYYSNFNLPAEKYCDDGDLLFAWSATFGPYIWHGPRCIYHYHIWKIELSPELHKGFAYYLLQNITDAVKSAGRGISMLHMTKSGMEDWVVSLPPLDEQRRIAVILDHADALRRLRARALEKLNTLGQAIFHEMFDHSLPLIPLAELVEQVEKRDPRSNTHADSFKYVDIGSVSHETKKIENAKKVVCADAPSRARQLIMADDILVSTVRPNLNAVAWVDDQLDGAIASTGFTVLRPQKNKLTAAYLYYWVRSEAFVSKMILQATGQSYPAVSDKIVKTSEIPFPSLTEQERFAAIISKVHENSSLKIKALEKFDALFTSLQHRAFRGEL